MVKQVVSLSNQSILVTGELSPGDLIVSEGARGLNEQSHVRVIE